MWRWVCCTVGVASPECLPQVACRVLLRRVVEFRVHGAQSALQILLRGAPCPHPVWLAESGKDHAPRSPAQVLTQEGRSSNGLANLRLEARISSESGPLDFL